MSIQKENFMKKTFLILSVIVFIGAGCVESTTKEVDNPPISIEPVGEPTVLNQEGNIVAETDVVFPIHDYAIRRTYKAFGEYIEDRFRGYHVGDDIEYVDVESDVPVYAIADGKVLQITYASGYGGVMVVSHDIDGRKINSVYGHIDLGSIELKTGDWVKKGQQIAVLGDHESEETDGERKHLHFALYEGGQVKINGYVNTEAEMDAWINPQNFFLNHDLDVSTGGRVFDPVKDLGGNIFHIAFEIPDGWEVEYIPSIESLNLFTLEGGGSARERSQIFIRYFDATDFLTLPTVTIHDTQDGTVGAGNYKARRYDIEKKADIENFKDQPLWRNGRHIVTDFRGKEGFTRYYVVAANSELDQEIYERVLESIQILE